MSNFAKNSIIAVWQGLNYVYNKFSSLCQYWSLGESKLKLWPGFSFYVPWFVHIIANLAFYWTDSNSLWNDNWKLTAQKWSFPSRIPSVNMTKSASCGSYLLKKSLMKTSFFVQWLAHKRTHHSLISDWKGHPE